jgi:hypothetical protein
MRSNPFILWFYFLDITITLFIRELNGFVDSCNPADLLDILNFKNFVNRELKF